MTDNPDAPGNPGRFSFFTCADQIRKWLWGFAASWLFLIYPKALLVFAGCLWYPKTRFFVYTKGRLSKI